MSKSIVRSNAYGGSVSPAGDTKIKRKAYFPRTPNLKNPLRAAVLDQKAYEHQKLSLTFTGALSLSEAAKKKAPASRRKSPLKAGDPVTFTWEVGRYKSSFVGYVYSVKQNSTPRRITTTVVCLGTSKKLRAYHNRVWRNVTATDVVRKIAKQKGLRVVIHDTTAKKKQISQTGLTDWQLLRQLAAQTGRVLWVNGTTLYFVKPDKWVKSKIAAARVFNYRKKVPIGMIIGQNLYAFKSNVPDEILGNEENPVNVGLPVEDEVLDYLETPSELQEDSFASDFLGSVDYLETDVVLPIEYLETYGVEPETTADGLLDETSPIIEADYYVPADGWSGNLEEA